jgi:hypothetical protein
MNAPSDSDQKIGLRAFAAVSRGAPACDLLLEIVVEREVCIVDAHARGNFAL